MKPAKRFLMMLAAAAIWFSLTACGQREESMESAGPQVSSASENQKIPETTASETKAAEENKPTKRNVTVSEIYSEDGIGSISEGMEYQYSFHVPVIEDDRPDAVYMNEEITELFGEMAKSSMECIENNEVPGWIFVTYERFQKEDILSLVIKHTSYYSYVEEYHVYNYDTTKGERIFVDDILEMKQVTQDQYLDAVRKAAAKKYDELNFQNRELYGYDNNPGDYYERRSWTISQDNITPSLSLYLDDEGNMKVIVPIGALVEMDYLYETLTLDFEENASVNMEDNYCEFLHAKLKDGKLSIRFDQTAMSERILEENGYSGKEIYGQDIIVNGLYSDYTNVFCGVIGSEPEKPFVFLLTEEGRVEYIDVITCLKGGYFCASGPLMGVEEVAGFQAKEDAYGIPGVYASCNDGRMIGLGEWIQIDQHNIAYRLMGQWGNMITFYTDGGGSYEDYFVLTLSDSGENVSLSDSNFAAGYEIVYNGYFTYLGMNEDGAVYYYSLWDMDGAIKEGTAALSVRYEDYSGAVYTGILYFKELGGDGMFSQIQGTTTRLIETYG